MRISVRQAADAHGAPGPVSDYVGQVIPVQLGDLAYPARLIAVGRVGFGGSSDVLLELDLLGAELLWNVLTNERNRPYPTAPAA